MYVIPAIGWIVKLLKGWTNRFNECVLIYAGLTGEQRKKNFECKCLSLPRYEILTVLILCSSFNY